MYFRYKTVARTENELYDKQVNAEMYMLEILYMDVNRLYQTNKRVSFRHGHKWKCTSHDTDLSHKAICRMDVAQELRHS